MNNNTTEPPLSERNDAFETEFSIDGTQFLDLFQYFLPASCITYFHSILIEKDTQNTWSIFPLPAFQEATLMHNIGTTKKDPTTIQDSLSILAEAIFIKHDGNNI